VPDPKYCRRQADICLALSLLADDHTLASILIARAHQFLAEAEQAEQAERFSDPDESAAAIECDKSDDGAAGDRA
jgi:hypothetical protein